MNSLLKEEILYDTIIARWEDDDPQFWDDVLWIEGQIPGRRDHKHGMERILDMVNNYLIEREVKYALDLQWCDHSHVWFHIGPGTSNPDFYDINKKTYELKRYNLPYHNPGWHHADVHLVWIEHELYEQRGWELIHLHTVPVELLDYPKWWYLRNCEE